MNWKTMSCPTCKMGRASQFNPKLLHFVSIFLIILVNSPNTALGTITVISEFTNATLATINDLPARFIPERFPFYGIQGYVVVSEPDNACGKVKPPPDRDPPDLEYPINWILLARRSPECHFQTKIENAQNAGYTAIIIHNVDSNSTEIMGVEDPSKIIIYATFVGSYDGEVLRNHSYGSACFIRIQDDFSINGYLLPFAIVVGLCFIVMIIFMLWQQVLRWMRERRRSRRRKLPASALKKIPTKKWTKGDPYETCAVCLDDFVEQDKIRVLPCAHGFHMKCIDPWLTKGRRVCPICKRKVIVADESFNRADSDTDTEDDSAPLLGTSSATSPSAVGRGSGLETFVQGGESSASLSVEHGSGSPSHSHPHISPENLPRVHNSRGNRGGVFSLIRSRHQNQRSAAAAAVPATSPPLSNLTDVLSVISSTRPRPRPSGAPKSSRSMDSDSSSMSSTPGVSPTHHAHVLAEVHHSTEILRQRMAEGEVVGDEVEVDPKGQQGQRSQPDLVMSTSTSNQTYVPQPEDEEEDVEILVVSDGPGGGAAVVGAEDDNSAKIWSSGTGTQDAFSSRDNPPNVNLKNSSSTLTSASISDNQNPIV